jgi:hypothetical protein
MQIKCQNVIAEAREKTDRPMWRYLMRIDDQVPYEIERIDDWLLVVISDW